MADLGDLRVAGLSALKAAARSATELRRRAEREPLSHMRWLPGQWEVFHDAARFRLFRAGNQSQGKTICGLAECIWEATGEHPYRPVTSPHKPAECWIICASWSQSLAIQSKLWSLLPKDRLHPETVFSPLKGFRGTNPAVRVRHRAGGWSIIRIKTTQQGALNLAGASIHFAMFDEPPASQRVFSEVQRRVQAANGRILLTLTPVNAPTDWLRDMVAEGKIEDHHFDLRAENLIPVGSNVPIRLADGTLCDEAWIEALRAEVLSYEAPVLLDGEWEFRATERVFEVFNPLDHVVDTTPAEFLQPGTRFLLGLDHGHDERKEVAVLVAVRDASKLNPYPRVHVVDLVRDDVGRGTPEQDARRVLTMLEANGLRWRDLDEVRGDKVHMKGSVHQKSNTDLAVAVARHMGLTVDGLRPQILSSKRGSGRGMGAPQMGVRWLHHQMLRPGHFTVASHVAPMIDAMNLWAGEEDSEHKDVVDALRYALDAYIFGTRRNTSAVRVALYGR